MGGKVVKRIPKTGRGGAMDLKVFSIIIISRLKL